ncbi:MAG: YlzJ-like family protein [Limnochordia bacterium]|jgi:hypothetical protein
MLHTIVPVEDVMEGWEEFNPQYVEISQGGLTMLVEPVSFGQGRLVRIFSTDPAAYLDPAHQPGSIINW